MGSLGFGDPGCSCVGDELRGKASGVLGSRASYVCSEIGIASFPTKGRQH